MCILINTCRWSLINPSKPDATSKIARFGGCCHGQDWQAFELENSPGYRLIHANEGLTYQHQVHPVDEQWRHALMSNEYMTTAISNNYAVGSDGFCAPILGASHPSYTCEGRKNSSTMLKKIKPTLTGQQFLTQSGLKHLCCHWPNLSRIESPQHTFLLEKMVKRTSTCAALVDNSNRKTNPSKLTRRVYTSEEWKKKKNSLVRFSSRINAFVSFHMSNVLMKAFLLNADSSQGEQMKVPSSQFRCEGTFLARFVKHEERRAERAG